MEYVYPYYTKQQFNIALTSINRSGALELTLPAWWWFHTWPASACGVSGLCRGFARLLVWSGDDDKWGTLLAANAGQRRHHALKNTSYRLCLRNPTVRCELYVTPFGESLSSFVVWSDWKQCDSLDITKHTTHLRSAVNTLIHIHSTYVCSSSTFQYVWLVVHIVLIV